MWNCDVLCTIIVPGYGGDISKQILDLRVLLKQIRLAVQPCVIHIYTHMGQTSGINSSIGCDTVVAGCVKVCKSV